MAAADVLVSKVVEVLSSGKYRIFRPFFLLDIQFRKLASNLRSIKAVIIDAGESRQLQDESVRLWLDSLRSVTFDIDDFLDECIYVNLRSQITWLKVRSFDLFSACFTFCFYARTAIRHHPLEVKLYNLNVRLSNIVSDRDKYAALLLKGGEEHYPRPVSTSGIDVPVLGREFEKARIVNLLLESSELQKLSAISIVGMAGIGKTTLAKLVYNDELVEAHFDTRIWVSVCKPFNKIRIAREIFESLVGHSLEIVDWESIAAAIQQFIEGKKFLLVLDDLWNENVNEWKQLEDYLMSGSSGSKILVTTRNENVAKLMGCLDQDVFQVALLSNEVSWSMFCEIAFSRHSAQERQNLESIGLQILDRCKGLPVAVKTLAGILHGQYLKIEWEYVLGSELWKLEIAKRDIFGPLWSSYNDLPLSLRQCFLYCMIFPKNYRMCKDELISLWMAHDFLNPTKDKNMVEIGNDYFHDLGIRSLFHDFEVEEKFNRLDKTYCKIHDIVHDFAEFLVGKECLYIDMTSVEEVGGSVDAAYNDGVYHLHVRLGENVEFLESFCNMPKLRSLIVSPPKNDSLAGSNLSKIFDKLTCLRSLSLSRCHLESVPSNIYKLIHLRWLNLSKNYALKELPETICELHHLQTLSVNWCDGLMHFPKGVEKLISLRLLKNEHTYFLLPKGIGKLSGLRRLSRITIDPKSKNAFSLRDLKNLNSIIGSLTIFFVARERERLVKDAKQAQLKEKKLITALTLNFPERAAEEWIQQEDGELVEALKPSLSLEMLRMTHYAGANGPSWISTLTSLKRLKLWYWSNCKHLPALANLPCLEHIELNYFGSVRKVTAEFYGVMEASSSTAPLFPKLKNLQFMNMIEWEEWNDYDGDGEVMPCLSYLSIENCPKLKALPNFISIKATLQKKIS